MVNKKSKGGFYILIGKKLKLLRELKELTQGKMADLLQLNRVT